MREMAKWKQVRWKETEKERNKAKQSKKPKNIYISFQQRNLYLLVFVQVNPSCPDYYGNSFRRAKLYL
jgi:hypothetical protein